MSVADLSAEWRAIMAEHDRIEDQRHEVEQSADFDFPMVQHGRRGRVYMRAEEVDRARRLSDATKARLKATLAERITAYDAARDACGLSALEDRVEDLRKQADRLEEAISATMSGSLDGVRAKLAIALRLATDCSYDTIADLLRSAVADADALADAERERAARETLWWVLLHSSEGWVYGADETSITLDLDGGPQGLQVPVLPGDEILPDVASPLWPAALAELQAARARGAYPLQQDAHHTTNTGPSIGRAA